MSIQDTVGLVKRIVCKTQLLADHLVSSQGFLHHRIQHGCAYSERLIQAQPVWMIVDPYDMGVPPEDGLPQCLGTLAWVALKCGHAFGGHVLTASQPFSTAYDTPEQSVWNLIKGVLLSNDHTRPGTLADGLQWAIDHLPLTHRVVVVSAFWGKGWQSGYVTLSRRHHLIPFRLNGWADLPMGGLLPITHSKTGDWLVLNSRSGKQYEAFLKFYQDQSALRQAVFKRLNTPEYVLDKKPDLLSMAMLMLGRHGSN